MKRLKEFTMRKKNVYIPPECIAYITCCFKNSKIISSLLLVSKYFYNLINNPMYNCCEFVLFQLSNKYLRYKDDQNFLKNMNRLSYVRCLKVVFDISKFGDYPGDQNYEFEEKIKIEKNTQIEMIKQVRFLMEKCTKLYEFQLKEVYSAINYYPQLSYTFQTIYNFYWNELFEGLSTNSLIKKLVLENCRKLKEGFFKNFPNLIDLSMIRLNCGERGYSFDNYDDLMCLNKLKTLSVKMSDFSFYNETTLKNLQMLKCFVFDSNATSFNVEDLNLMKNIEVLKIIHVIDREHGKETWLSSKYFVESKKLKELYVENVEIIGGDIFKSPSLKCVTMERVKFLGVNEIASLSLETIILKRCSFRGDRNGIKFMCENLKCLEIVSCVGINDTSFHSLQSLEYLEVRKIPELSSLFLKGFYNLKYLDLCELDSSKKIISSKSVEYLVKNKNLSVIVSCCCMKKICRNLEMIVKDRIYEDKEKEEKTLVDKYSLKERFNLIDQKKLSMFHDFISTSVLKCSFNSRCNSIFYACKDCKTSCTCSTCGKIFCSSEYKDCKFHNGFNCHFCEEFYCFNCLNFCDECEKTACFRCRKWVKSGIYKFCSDECIEICNERDDLSD